MSVEIIEAIEAAVSGEPSEPKPEASDTAPESSPFIEDEVQTILGTEITPRPINWLWPGYLALGKLHVLGGRPGCGKTTLAMTLAADATNGTGWPDNHVSIAGNVLIWSGEDDSSDTLLPRLSAAGAKLGNIHFIGQTSDADGIRPFDPSTDMEALQRRIRQIGEVKLLIVDPLVSACAVDDHKNGAVRRALQPLSDLAASTNTAVLGIHHFTKNSVGKSPLDRVTGSLAYGAAARIVLVAAMQKDSPVRIFCRAKSNIGADDGGFEYTLKQSPLPDAPDIVASSVQWGKPLEGDAQELLDAAEVVSQSGGSALTEAVDFIKDALKDGAMSIKEVRQAATDCGISEKTLRRARESLGVRTISTGFGSTKNFFWTPDAAPTSELKKNSSEPAYLPKKPLLAQHNTLGK